MLKRSLIAISGLTLTPVLMASLPAQPGRPEHRLAARAGQAASVHSAFVAVHRLDPDDNELAAAQLTDTLEATARLAGVHHLFVVDDRALFDLTGVAPSDIGASHGDGVVSVFQSPDGGVLFTARGDPSRPAHEDHLRAEYARVTRASGIAHYNLPERTRLALQGYDPVSYFSPGRPEKGDPRYESDHRGVTYRFANDEHRRRFNADPERFLPTYGGWCASAMADGGRKVAIDPTNYKVKDGRLFLFFKSAFGDARKDWNRREAEWEPAADGHWARISGERPTHE